jgi:hypothetical protein
MYDHAREEHRDRERRLGLERDPREEHQHELDLTERIAEQASLPTSHPLVVAAVRHRLGRGPSPYEGPQHEAPDRFVAGERVNHHGPNGPRPGVVVRAFNEEALVEVDFGEATTIVDVDELERRAA